MLADCEAAGAICVLDSGESLTVRETCRVLADGEKFEVVVVVTGKFRGGFVCTFALPVWNAPSHSPTFLI